MQNANPSYLFLVKLQHICILSAWHNGSYNYLILFRYCISDIAHVGTFYVCGKCWPFINRKKKARGAGGLNNKYLGNWLLGRPVLIFMFLLSCRMVNTNLLFRLHSHILVGLFEFFNGIRCAAYDMNGNLSKNVSAYPHLWGQRIFHDKMPVALDCIWVIPVKRIGGIDWTITALMANAALRINVDFNSYCCLFICSKQALLELC